MSVATAVGRGAVRLPGRLGHLPARRGRGARRWRRSTCASPRARASRCRARRARGRRRSCTCSAASSSRPRARCSGGASRSPRSTPPPAARARAGGIAYVLQGSNLLPTFSALRERRLRGLGRRASGAGPPGTSPPSCCELVGLAAKADGAAGRALRRRGAAGRARPGARPVAAAAALRRADRPPRLRHRRARPRPARGAARALRLRPRDRDPRPRRRRALPAQVAPRRRARDRGGGGVVSADAAARHRPAATRSPAQTATQALVLAAAVALLGSMVLFIGHSLRTMTASATRSVPLDLPGPGRLLRPGARAGRRDRRQPDVAQASAGGDRPLRGRRHRGAAGVTSAGAGAILAVPPGYLHQHRHLPLPARRPAPGRRSCSTSSWRRRCGRGSATRSGSRLGGSAPAARFRVGGVALVTAPDVLFQPLNPQLGPAPAQPPANIAILPLGTFARTLAPQLPSLAPASAGSAAVPGAQSGVQWQVQAQVDRAASAARPSDALKRAGPDPQLARTQLPGQDPVRRQPLRSARNGGRRRALRARRSSSCSRFPAPCWRSASPTWRRWERSNATAASSPCSARAARAAAQLLALGG